MNDLFNQPKWDKLSFSYQTVDDNAEIELPFKMLILGDFTQSNQDGDTHLLKPSRVSFDTFNQFFASQSLTIQLEMAVADIDENISYIDVDVNLKSMADFEAFELVNSVPYLKAHKDLMVDLQVILNKNNLDGIYFSEAQKQLLKQCNVQPDSITIAELPFILCDVNEHLYEMLDIVLHHSKFQKLESIWRNLKQLLNSAKEIKNTHFEILDISQQHLDEDFYANRDIRESILFDIVYFQEYAQYGGHPYTAIIADYEFANGAQDLALLKNIANVCHAAHVPFIAGLSAKFMGCETFDQLASLSDLSELYSSSKYIKWRNFQQDVTSSYIGLVLPSINLRKGYNYPAGVLGGMPYRENVRGSNNVLLGNASFAYAQCLVNSFAKYNVCTDLCGPVGGAVSVEYLSDSTNRIPDFPIECVFSETKLNQLSNLGLLPLAVNKRQNEIFFNTAGSLRWGSLSIPTTRTTAEKLNGQVEAQLPYLFIISRIAHYLKVVQREQIGSLDSISELQTELNRWLRRFTSDVENPAASVRSRKPLKKAEIVITGKGVDEIPQMSLSVVPHMKYLGNDFVLTLNFSTD
ncbi:type VI secretion system contractile sheath large subunit [uncultured Psychrosphaera sp.]|uniref:type VI secretion system contractile sheath large subunit n=1 Tax=uncultured Psychrosphaera sp. TaxID=1403522 RepID=UPI0030FCDAD0